MRGGAAWNKDKTASVILSKIKEISILERTSPAGENRLKISFSVRGWFNKENFFSFGDFDSLQEAQDFVQKIHDQL